MSSHGNAGAAWRLRAAAPRRLGALAWSGLLAATLAGCSGGAAPRAAALLPVTPIMLPPAMAADAVPDLTGPAWRWHATQTPAGARPVNSPDRYTVQFTADGRVQVQADCNRGSGRYTLSSDGALTLTGIATTKMGCPAGSLDAAFLRELGEAERAHVAPDGLVLMLRNGAGTMRFTR
jgi:heat shock protein HslJ